MEINSTSYGLSRLVSFSAILVLTVSAITSAQEKPVDKVNIGSYRIKKRPLLIFAPSDKERDFAEQVENLKPYAEGLLERDVIVLVILEEGISRVENKDMTPKAAEALRKKMKIKSGEFKVILITKGGAEKFRTSAPITSESLFAAIDSMGLRKAEIEEKQRKAQKKP
jgi:hypothetical protein